MKMQTLFDSQFQYTPNQNEFVSFLSLVRPF